MHKLLPMLHLSDFASCSKGFFIYREGVYILALEHCRKMKLQPHLTSEYSLDHEIQRAIFFSSPHKLENFHWYHELGPLLGFTNQVFASLRSGAVCIMATSICTPYNHPEIFKIRHCLDVFDAALFT